MTATTSRLSRQALPVIERASPADRAFLAMDSEAVPEQFGVILLLDQAARFDLPGARRLMPSASRLSHGCVSG